MLLTLLDDRKKRIEEPKNEIVIVDTGLQIVNCHRNKHDTIRKKKKKEAEAEACLYFTCDRSIKNKTSDK